MLLTIDQSAERLNSSSWQVRLLIEAGDLPYVNIGSGNQRRTIRIEAKALEEFISRRTTSTPAPTKRNSPRSSREWV